MEAASSAIWTPPTQDAILRDLSASEDGAAQVELLLRVCWEGYYAARHAMRPAGLDMVGYHDVPPGVTPIEPPPLRTVSSLDLRPHYDAVVVGSGPGGGAAALTLARAGRSVLVVERAANLGNAALRGDHLRGKRNGVYDVTVAPGTGHPRVFDGGVVVDGDGDSTSYGLNAMAVGGGTRVWQAMAWRFMPEDFAMATTYGVPEGSSLADWPISYADLEPYYTQAEWELGVAGEEGGLTGRTPRTSRVPHASHGLRARAGGVGAGRRAPRVEVGTGATGHQLRRA